MAKKNQADAAEAANVQNETAVAKVTPQTEVFAHLEAFEKMKTDEMIEVTSEVLKLEAGEEFTGILTNQIEMVESNEEGKAPFEAAVLYAKNKSKVLCADVVVLSNQKKIFAGMPENQIHYKVVKMVSNGMRKSQGSSTKEYRDIRIYTA